MIVNYLMIIFLKHKDVSLGKIRSSHQLIRNGKYYGMRVPEFDFEAQDECHVKLDSMIKRVKHSFIDEYDFDDSWEHQVILEKMSSPKAEAHFLINLAGKRACPSENCGSIGGQYEF